MSNYKSAKNICQVDHERGFASALDGFFLLMLSQDTKTLTNQNNHYVKNNNERGRRKEVPKLVPEEVLTT